MARYRQAPEPTTPPPSTKIKPFSAKPKATHARLLGPGDNVSLLQIIHPGEQIGLDSDPKLLGTARNTLAYMNSDPKNPSWRKSTTTCR